MFLRRTVLDTLDNFSIIERYRLSREMIFRLIDEVKDKLEPPTKRSHAVPTQLQVLVALTIPYNKRPICILCAFMRSLCD